nr:MAG TPA: hypothetical protein [Crassvirales sp.]
MWPTANILPSFLNIIEFLSKYKPSSVLESLFSK